MDRADEIAHEVLPDGCRSLMERVAIRKSIAAALRRCADERLEEAAKVAEAADQYPYAISGKIVAVAIRAMKEAPHDPR